MVALGLKDGGIWPRGEEEVVMGMKRGYYQVGKLAKAWRWGPMGPGASNNSIWRMCGGAEVGCGSGRASVKLKTIKLLNFIPPPSIPERSPS